MIYVVIGPSNAGKTMFVTNSFIKNHKCIYYKDIIGVTETDTTYLIGNWLLDNRVKGTDVVARQDIKYIFDQIEKLNSVNPNKDIVIEGFKIHSRPLINKLLEHNYKVVFYYLYCSLETSIKRNLTYNPKSTATYRLYNWTYTSAKNLYLDYKNKVESHFMNTEKLTEFTEFQNLNLNTFVEDDDSILTNKLF